MTHPSPVPDARFIDTPAELAGFCQAVASSPWLALDTEFVRERTYFAQLCLIQVAAANGQIACIDTLAIQDLSPLFELLQAPAVSKILHAVSQDLEVLYQNHAPRIQPLFDTQLAAGLLGQGDQIGYAGLVQQMLEVALAKGHARTDWSRRPLSAEQLVYAADDVRYLGAMYEALQAQLQASGRESWLNEDMDRLNQPANFAPSPASAWQRLKGLGRLSAAGQQRAARLAAWREQRAVERDLPRRWILADAPLLELAHRAPTSGAELARIVDLPPKLIETQGDALLALLSEPVSEQQPLVMDWGRPDAQEKALQKRLKDCVQQVAEQLQMNASLLATRSDIEALARGERHTQALRGWRAEVIGAPLVDALAQAV